MIEEFFEEIDNENPNALKMDGYDDCIIGIARKFSQESVIAYDIDKIIKKLMRNGCETWEDAMEFFEFNQLGAGMGESGPIFIDLKN